MARSLLGYKKVRPDLCPAADAVFPRRRCRLPPQIPFPRRIFPVFFFSHLTNSLSLRYNQSLQGCPCIHGHWPSANCRTAHVWGNFEGGNTDEADFPAEEASAQPRPWLFEAHVFQERPQGSGPPPCQGPQEPDRLIRTKFIPQTRLLILSVAFFAKCAKFTVFFL